MRCDFKAAKAVSEEDTANKISLSVDLVKLGTDEKKTFEKVSTFSFNNDGSSVLAINLPKDGNGEGKGSDLLIYNLSTEKALTLGNVLEFSFNKPGTYLAYTVDAANKSGNGIYLLNLSNNSTTVLENDKAS